MSHYRITDNYSYNVHGRYLPKGALYGVCNAYERPVDFCVVEYPSRRKATICIWVWNPDKSRWFLPKNPLKLYDYVFSIIDKHNLWGKKLIPYMTNKQIERSQTTPIRKFKGTALKQAQSRWERRGEEGGNSDYAKRYGDIIKNGEWQSKCTKTIIEKRTYKGSCTSMPKDHYNRSTMDGVAYL